MQVIATYLLRQSWVSMYIARLRSETTGPSRGHKTVFDARRGQGLVLEDATPTG